MRDHSIHLFFLKDGKCQLIFDVITVKGSLRHRYRRTITLERVQMGRVNKLIKVIHSYAYQKSFVIGVDGWTVCIRRTITH